MIGSIADADGRRKLRWTQRYPAGRSRRGSVASVWAESFAIP
jgi:hypothetical protein